MKQLNKKNPQSQNFNSKMVDNKKIIKELSSLNEELNEILKKENIKIPQSYLYKNEQNHPINSNEFELLSMIKDVRDEINILRRNLFSDIESFVNKKINNDQDKFFQKIEESVSKLLKESIISRNQHISELKHEFSNTNIKINKLTEEIDNLKSLNSTTKSIYQEIQTYQFELENNLKSKIDNLENSLTSRFVEISYSMKSNGSNNSPQVLELKNQYLPTNNVQNNNREVVKTSELSSKIESRISRIDAALRKLEE